MELELGLALSTTTNHFVSTPKLKEMDLISHVNYQVNHDYGGDDNSTLSSQSSVNNHDNDDDDDEDDEDDGLICYVNHHGMKKRCFEVESFDFGNKTLPLLVWDKEPNQHDEQPYSLCNSSFFAFNKNEEDEIVGWPPIKSRRKKQCQQNDAQQHHQLLSRGRCFPVEENGGACGGFGSMYVKVQMDGCFITRKIDLKLYESYQSLTSTLLALFGKGQDSVESYKLTYQDKDGDWLLVGDIPWSAFIGSVQRLKLLRRED